MPFVSVTRLRIRALRFLPGFALHTTRANRQVRAAAGFRGGALLPDRRFTFWTLTLWDSIEDMRTYIASGAHKVAMPKLMHWCDEASIVHWEQDSLVLPDWAEADARMRREGRPSKLRRPSAAHKPMTFAAPRLGGGAAIVPDRARF